MRIAICDKDAVFSKKLKHILYTYSNRHNFDFFVETFDSGEELLKSENKYLIIFIEYSLTGINGLETVKEMRKQNDNTKIIFLTNNTRFIFEAFRVNPYRFLTKPLNQAELIKTLDELFYDNNINYPLQITDGITTHCIDTNEITYLEADNKYCYVHLYDNVILCKKTMARVYEALPKIHFAKINRSFVVNLNCIDKYNNENVFLKNGVSLHMTRTYSKNFKNNYTDYLHPEII